MAKLPGRKVKLSQGAVPTLVAGGREHSISINNEPIDVTDKDDDGWRTLLADPATRSVDISATLLFDEQAFIATALSSTTTGLIDDFEVEIDGFGTIAGKFHISTVELNSPHDDAAELPVTLASSGPITFTAAP